MLDVVNAVGREALDGKAALESRSEEDEGMLYENKWGKSILGQEETCKAPNRSSSATFEEGQGG